MIHHMTFDPKDRALTEHTCGVYRTWSSGGWRGRIKIEYLKTAPGTDMREVVWDDITVYECGPYETDVEAADALRKWCHDRGIGYYMGPVLSGAIG